MALLPPSWVACHCGHACICDSCTWPEVGVSKHNLLHHGQGTHVE
jgi:hypothetical protein